MLQCRGAPVNLAWCSAGSSLPVTESNSHPPPCGVMPPVHALAGGPSAERGPGVRRLVPDSGVWAAGFRNGVGSRMPPAKGQLNEPTGLHFFAIPSLLQIKMKKKKTS